jgi:TonB-linked SusC/RagA family outer membrane protein
MNKNSLFKGKWWIPIFLWVYLILTPIFSYGSICVVKSKVESHKVIPSTALGMTQSIVITGTVSDSQGVMPGVTVSVKGKSTTTVTNYDGTYSLTASTTDILVFSFIGYKTLTVPIAGRTAVNVQLQEDATQLQEVKINAGYYTVKESERTGSIAKITSKDIENQPVTNVLAAMQGRMAGVNITQTTGTPGGGFSVQIRGLNSVRTAGNNPLYIIDGIPYSTDAIGSGQNATGFPSRLSPLNSINPDQIDSIEVLKDADATAIYGSRGANGVVLITTKKGKQGKTKFTTNLSTGAGTVTRFIDLVNTEQYIAMRKEAFVNDGITQYPEAAYDINGTWDQTRYTNWQKALLGGTSLISELQSSVSGGSAQTQFLMSGNFNKQTTIYPGDFVYKKANVHLNINHESEDKKFRTSFSAGYTLQDNNQSRIDLNTTALQLAPNAPALYGENGELNWENSTFNNPLANFVGGYNAKTHDLLASSLLSYRISDAFEIRSNFGYSTIYNDEVNGLPSTMFDPASDTGPEFSTLIVGRNTRKTWIAEPQINWKRQFKNIAVDVLAGSTFQSQTSTQLVQVGQGFSSNSLLYNIASATTVTIPANDETQYKYQALFGRINLNWKERYIVNLTGRRDGSSRFGPGKQYANFGAVGAAWLFSKERFTELIPVLSFGKIRASYGVTGNDQIGDYQFLDTYGSTGVNYGGTIGLQPTRLYNPAFGWETNKKFEVALEVGFFKDRVFLTAGWYKNRSSNQLTGIPLPGTTGFTVLQSNLDALVENKGTEFTLRTVNLENSVLTWSTNLNLTLERNTLLEYPDLDTSTFRNTYVIGEPLNIKKVYHFTGVDSQTGIYTFEDKNGDGLYTTKDDKTDVRDFNPEFYGGLQNTVKYKHWQLDFLFQFVKQLNYNGDAAYTLPGSMFNQPVSALDHWKQPGDIASHQIYTDGSNATAVAAYDRYLASDAVISDASYIRLKNISISYDLPEKILKNMRCRIFMEGQNVLTFTKYQGADPEFKSVGYLPPLRILTAGLQFTF